MVFNALKNRKIASFSHISIQTWRLLHAKINGYEGNSYACKQCIHSNSFLQTKIYSLPKCFLSCQHLRLFVRNSSTFLLFYPVLFVHYKNHTIIMPYSFCTICARKLATHKRCYELSHPSLLSKLIGFQNVYNVLYPSSGKVCATCRLGIIYRKKVSLG